MNELNSNEVFYGAHPKYNDYFQMLLLEEKVSFNKLLSILFFAFYYQKAVLNEKFLIDFLLETLKLDFIRKIKQMVNYDYYCNLYLNLYYTNRSYLIKDKQFCSYLKTNHRED